MRNVRRGMVAGARAPSSPSVPSPLRFADATPTYGRARTVVARVVVLVACTPR
jgi:hypothetical protein